jgi:hypothetical protein
LDAALLNTLFPGKEKAISCVGRIPGNWLFYCLAYHDITEQFACPEDFLIRFLLFFTTEENIYDPFQLLPDFV